MSDSEGEILWEAGHSNFTNRVCDFDRPLQKGKNTLRDMSAVQ